MACSRAGRTFAPLLPDPRERVMGERLVGVVVVEAGDGEGPAQVIDRLVQPPQIGVGTSETPVRADVAGGVGEVLRGDRTGLAHGEQVVAVPPPVVEGEHGAGQLPDAAMPSVGDRDALGGQQARVFGVAPGQGRRGIGQRAGEAAGHGRIEPDGLAVGVHELVGGVGGVQVEVDDPAQCRLPVGSGLILAGPVGGVEPDQIVHPSPAGNMLVHQGNLVQRPQHPPDRVEGQAGEGGRGRQADVRPGASPSRPNTRARSGVRARHDQDSTAGTPAACSVSSSAASRVVASRSSAASAANGNRGWARARPATMPNASGNPPQQAISSVTAPGSAAGR